MQETQKEMRRTTARLWRVRKLGPQMRLWDEDPLGHDKGVI